MALEKQVVFVACAILTVCYGTDTFDNLLTSVTPCEEVCTKSYSPHTNPSDGEDPACARGCRFYSISEYVMTDKPDHGNAVDGKDAHPVKSTCYDSCVEAYNSTSRLTAACKFGCDTQAIKSEEPENTKNRDEGLSIHLLSPLLQVRSVYSSVIGAVHVWRSSIVTFFRRDDDSILAVESEPEIMMEVVPEAVGRPSPLEAKLQPRQLPVTEPMEDTSVVRCVSRRLGVPPYLLVASVLVLVLFTIYIIFAVCSTATPTKIKGGLSVQADSLPLPVKLVRPEDLTRLSLMEEDDVEAPPLPTKVKLPDTDI